MKLVFFLFFFFLLFLFLFLIIFLFDLNPTVQAAAVNTKTPIVVVLIHGGPLDVSWMHNSDRVGAIMSAWYPGQVSTPYYLSD